jgi:hypothetical protein
MATETNIGAIGSTTSFCLSGATVTVQIINTTTNVVCPTAYFLEPTIKGQEHLNLPTFAFLIENKALGKRVLFDLGCRKDWWNLVCHEFLQSINPIYFPLSLGLDETYSQLAPGSCSSEGGGGQAGAKHNAHLLQSPAVQDSIRKGVAGIEVSRGIDEILSDGGVDLDTIDSIVLRRMALSPVCSIIAYNK